MVQSVIRINIGILELELSMASSTVVLKIVIMDTSVYLFQMASSLAIATGWPRIKSMRSRSRPRRLSTGSRRLSTGPRRLSTGPRRIYRRLWQHFLSSFLSVSSSIAVNFCQIVKKNVVIYVMFTNWQNHSNVFYINFIENTSESSLFSKKKHYLSFEVKKFGFLLLCISWLNHFYCICITYSTHQKIILRFPKM